MPEQVTAEVYEESRLVLTISYKRVTNIEHTSTSVLKLELLMSFIQLQLLMSFLQIELLMNSLQTPIWKEYHSHDYDFLS